MSCQSFGLGMVSQKKWQKNYIATRKQNTLQKRIAFSWILEENQWKKYWQCSVETSHSVGFFYYFYFETTFCLDFFFFFYFVLAFLLQHNINFKKSKSKQNVSVSSTTKPVNHLEIHWRFFKNSLLLRIPDFGGFIAIHCKVNFWNLKDLWKQDSCSLKRGQSHSLFSFCFRLLSWKVVKMSHIHICKAVSDWAPKNHTFLCLMLTLHSPKHHLKPTAFSSASLSPDHLLANFKGIKCSVRTAHEVFWAFLFLLSFSSSPCCCFAFLFVQTGNCSLLGWGKELLSWGLFSLAHNLFMVSGLLSGACKLLTVQAELNQLWQDSMRKLTVPPLVL